MTPDDVERMCQEAIVNGADPVRLEQLKAAAMREQGGTMAALAYNMTVHLRLEQFERSLGIPAPRERELAHLRQVMAKYPDEAEKMLAVLQELHRQRDQG
ncbi:hypothetical protein [Microbispora sp. NPDC049633]|uniref:hypothetical protein n=1 Tax=Microbispora sp. NPDC049633 TaxID=3154355 RepID=UPI003446239F